MPPYDIHERTFQFACAIVELGRFLDGREQVIRRLSWQLLKAGTSIGANLAEANSGQTKPDFRSKVFISLKESRETSFWLRLIATTDQGTATRISPLAVETSELIAILTTIAKNSEASPDRKRRKP